MRRGGRDFFLCRGEGGEEDKVEEETGARAKAVQEVRRRGGA